MDRLESMAIVVTAAELRSFSAAARKLRLPLTTVSRRVSDLEAHLQARLFVRGGRRLQVTEAGQAYLAAARAVLEQVEQAERAVRGEYLRPRGQLVVSAPIVFGRLHVLPVALEFLAAYPDVSLRLALSDGVVNLAEERVDVALRIGALPDSSLKAARLGTVRVVTVASPGYLKRRGRPRAPTELERHACVQRGTQAWTYQSGTRRLAVTVKPRLEVGTSEAALDAAVAGLGITQLFSYQVAGAVSGKRLEVLLADFEPPPLPVNLVYLGEAAVLPVKLRAFLDFGVSRLKARVDGASLPAPECPPSP